MPATKITDLLPIPEGAREPHAYQVFGLEDGEQDLAKISTAVQATVKRLKEAKSHTDAKLWSTAARLVQDARITLTDPDKKAQLDARFGIVSIASDAGAGATPAATSSADPLAGVLPSADPLAAVLPPSDPLAPVQPAGGAVLPPPGNSPAPTATPHAASMPPGVFAAPQQAPEPAAAAPVTPVVVRQPKRGRRRRTSALGMLIFLVFFLGLIAVIGMLGYFLMYGSGQVAITNTDGQITISTKPPADNQPPEVSPPYQVNDKPPRQVDPVMGNLAGDVPPPARNSEPSGLEFGGLGEPGGNFREPSNVGQPGTDPPSESGPPMSPESPEPPTSEPPTSEPPTSEPPPTEPEMEPLSDEMIAAADKELSRVENLIREANWKEMKPAAEAAAQMTMNDEQKARAAGLLELADLATYYRGGIERAVAGLNVGNDFAVTETFRVIVVEKGEDQLVVRYNEKNRSFTFDEFPFALAHKLGTFSMPGSPTGQAAKAAYQAIAPRTNDDYRAEAVTWLREIKEEIDGVDPKRVADTIEALFGGNA